MTRSWLCWSLQVMHLKHVMLDFLGRTLILGLSLSCWFLLSLWLDWLVVNLFLVFLSYLSHHIQRGQIARTYNLYSVGILLLIIVTLASGLQVRLELRLVHILHLKIINFIFILLIEIRARFLNYWVRLRGHQLWRLEITVIRYEAALVAAILLIFRRKALSIVMENGLQGLDLSKAIF